MLLALALVHHLAIGSNIPLPQIAEFFSKTGQYLIIEFIPKEDSQVKKLLTNRKDVFTSYDQNGFETSFEKYFTILKKTLIEDSLRTLYLMKVK